MKEIREVIEEIYDTHMESLREDVEVIKSELRDFILRDAEMEELI